VAQYLGPELALARVGQVERGAKGRGGLAAAAAAHQQFAQRVAPHVLFGWVFVQSRRKQRQRLAHAPAAVGAPTGVGAQVGEVVHRLEQRRILLHRAAVVP